MTPLSLLYLSLWLLLSLAAFAAHDGLAARHHYSQLEAADWSSRAATLESRRRTDLDALANGKPKTTRKKDKQSRSKDDEERRLMRANDNSKVEKGTKTDLPTGKKLEAGSSSGPERKDGLAPASTPSKSQPSGASSSRRSPSKRSGQSRAALDTGKHATLNKHQRAKSTAKEPKVSGLAVAEPSIQVNGRKFDQVNPVECVDERFYEMLSADLRLIKPEQRLDFYDSYFNPEYAKTIEAIVDQSSTKGSSAVGLSSSQSKADKLASSTGELPGAGKDASVESAGVPDDILGLVRSFWSETHERYLQTRASLNLTHLPLLTLSGRRKRRDLASGDNESRPVYQAALDNYRYLLSRLEQLKGILLKGEEALIAVNNRVRKLNQVVREEELQQALCACITCRGGRAALMLMNEIFADKNGYSLLERPEMGAKKAEDAARDTAEFCSYWYGDTIRAETLQKEPQIKKLVLELAKEKAAASTEQKVEMETLQNKSISSSHSNQAASLKSTNASHITSPVGNATSHSAPDGASMSNQTTISKKTLTSTNGTTTSVTTTTTVKIKIVKSIVDMSTLWTPKLADWIKKTLNMSATLAKDETKSRSKRRAQLGDELPFSTPFDHDGLYSEVDLDELEPHLELEPLAPARLRRQAPTLANVGSNKSDTLFEQRMGAHSFRCALYGFSGLLDVAYDQNKLMYETSTVKRDHKYIKAIREAFTGSFERQWRVQRDIWSKKLASGASKSNMKNWQNETSISGAKSDRTKSPEHLTASWSSSQVDQDMDVWESAFDSLASSYDRGAALGFTVGQFVGAKAAHQWPDPAELNTFTYDSIFLAGVAHGHKESDSKRFERLIVSETAKRIAFTEANRKSFARAIHLSYLNGAFLVPKWGILHSQRSLAKEAAREGARVGYEAAVEATREFAPKAMKFLRDHQHQRSLAAPYKSEGPALGEMDHREAGSKWAGLADKLSELQLESELNGNISHSAIDCGQKSGALMGALMGLLVTPEAFETYTRSRGSLEALENEFNQYKLGAMRAYELGETWAYLNYTAELNLHLRDLKSRMPKHHLDESTGGPKSGKLTNNGSSHKGNSNNIFQYMVLNYGSHLVANHSSRHMLKLRSPMIDEHLLEDLKVQARDLVSPERLSAIGKLNRALAQEQDPDDPFESIHDGRFVGDLKGAFNTINQNRTKPIKFNIIDLGPELEIEDQLEGRDKSAGVDAAALTSSLAKLAKVFIKFNVARRKKAHAGPPTDPVAAYLNSQQFDEGDGYLAGTFSLLSGRQAGASQVQDDLGVDVARLDQLFHQIEAATEDTVNLVEQSGRLATMAPRRVSQLSATSSRAPLAATTSSARPIPSTSIPETHGAGNSSSSGANKR